MVPVYFWTVVAEQFWADAGSTVLPAQLVIEVGFAVLQVRVQPVADSAVLVHVDAMQQHGVTCLLADENAILNHAEFRWGYIHRDSHADIVAVGSSMVLTSYGADSYTADFYLQLHAS